MNIKKTILTSATAFFLIAVSITGCKTVPDQEKFPEEIPEELPAEKPVEPETPESEEQKETEQQEPVYTPYLSRKLLEQGKMNAFELADFFMDKNPEYNYEKILNLAYYYVEESAAENINSDVAFAQMCHETGFLRFGGLVQPEWHNYCGLGAMSEENPGEKFDTEQLGVRAHIQHLHAYATTEDVKLHKPLIDPRYSWVHKTKYIQNIEELTGTWATDPRYAEKLETILRLMEQTIR